MGRLARHIGSPEPIDFADLPHFPQATALSHRGRLICGRLAGTPVVAMEGRCHRYEGYTLEQLSLPVFAMAALGVETLVLSNASGGLNPRFASGDVMVIDDHINMMFWRERFAAPQPRAGTRWIYDRRLIERALEAARRNDFTAHRGVYVAMTGPNYETPAEYRFLRRIGGDVVGMSTVPEAQAAASCGLRTLGLSVVTNVARPDCPWVVKAEEVVAAAESAEPKLRAIVLDVVAKT